MKREEILRKSIEKAEKNGYQVAAYWQKFEEAQPGVFGSKRSRDFFMNKTWNRYYGVIFSHSFAKAFWGSIPVCRDCKGSIDKDNKPQNGKYCSQGWHEAYLLLPWQYHLQQMVLEENPLEYLAKFLKGK